MFISEIDNNLIDESFKILDYETVIHKKNNDSDKTRIIALVKDSVSDRTKIRSDVMIENYPDIWIQFNDEKK